MSGANIIIKYLFVLIVTLKNILKMEIKKEFLFF